MIRAIIFSVCFCYSFTAFGLEKNELPEPLSFNDTITFAKKKFHHTFLLARTRINAAQATLLNLNSGNDLTIHLKGYLRKVGVSSFGDPENDNDSKVSLIAKKNIYDFGLTSSKEKYAQRVLQAKIIENELEQELYLNKVVEAYLNVLRADNDFLLQNEAMSIAFVRFKHRQDNIEFGLSSDLDILKAQSHYESVRQKRYLSEANQRFTRQQLAELLGSLNLPDQLELPLFSRQGKIIDDVDAIVNLALLNSKEMLLNQAKILAAKQAVQMASHTQSANIEAELEVSDYQRGSSFRDDWRASINFNFPLYTGDREGSAILLAQINYNEMLAKLNESQSLLRIKVLKLWQEINQKTVELEGAILKQEYRDLYLEQSRADYELEYTSDLGDAMVEFSRSRAQRYDIEFDLEMAWRNLDMLVGENNVTKIVTVQKVVNKPLENEL